MKKTFPAILLLILAFGCKEITYTPAVLAEYSLGNGDSCTGAVLSGRYIADTPLTAAEFMTVQVNVRVAGPYWITTQTANGITFSSIGTFSSTGSQVVALAGSGTPIAADTTAFTITPRSNDSTGCTIVVPVIAKGPPHYYLYAFVNGTYINFGDSAFATNGAAPGTSGNPGLDISGRDTVPGSVDRIDFGVNNPGVVRTGNYPDSATPPAYILYTDNNGNRWKTDTSLHPVQSISVDNIFTASLHGTFGGWLRRENASDSMLISGGVFFVPLR